MPAGLNRAARRALGLSALAAVMLGAHLFGPEHSAAMALIPFGFGIRRRRRNSGGGGGGGGLTTALALGMNSNASGYSVNQHTFHDLVIGQTIMYWDTTLNSGAGGWVSEVPAAYLDANGWPTSMPPNAAWLQITCMVPDTSGPYKLTWDDPSNRLTVVGTGGGTGVTQSGNSITFTSPVQPNSAFFYMRYSIAAGGGYPSNFKCRLVTDDGSLLAPNLKGRAQALCKNKAPWRFIKMTSIEDNRATNYNTLKYPVDGDGQLLDKIFTSTTRNTGPLKWLDGISLENLIAQATDQNTAVQWSAPWNCDATYLSTAASKWAAFAVATGKKVNIARANECWNFGYVVAIQCLNEAYYHAQQFSSKTAVRCVATGNITLSGTQTIDGVAVVAGDRVLCAGQTTASQNGVYVVAAGAWSRAADTIVSGDEWQVTAGTSNGPSTYRVRTTGTITVGTTALSITRFMNYERYAEKAKELFDAFISAFTSAGVLSLLECGLEWQHSNTPTSVWDAMRAIATNATAIRTAVYVGNNTGGEMLAAGFGTSYVGPITSALWASARANCDTILTYSSQHYAYAQANGLRYQLYECGPQIGFTDATTFQNFIHDAGNYDYILYLMQSLEAICPDLEGSMFVLVHQVQTSPGGAYVPTTTYWGFLEGTYQTPGANTPKYNAMVDFYAGKRLILAPTTSGLSVPTNSANGTVVGTVTWTQTGPTASLSNNALGAFAITPVDATHAQITVADSTKITSAGNQTITVDLTWSAGTNSPLSTNFSVNVYAPFSANFNFIAGTYNVSGTSYGSLAAVPGYAYSRSDSITVLDSTGSTSTFAAGVVPINGLGLHSYAALTKGNELQNGSQLDNAIWGKVGVTVTADTDVAPDGTTSGDTLSLANTSSRINQGSRFALTVGETLTFSFFAKRGSATDAKFAIANGSAVAYVGPTSFYAQINSSTWTRVVQTFNVGADAGALCAPLWLTSPAGTTKVWGVQLIHGNFPDGGPLAPLTSTATQPCDLAFTAPNGTYSATYTFDDNSTQVVSHTVSDGKFHIDTAPTLNRGRIKSLVI